MTAPSHRRRVSAATVGNRPYDQASVPPVRTNRPRLLTWLIVVNVILGIWYFTWLLSPAHAGTPWVYGLLVIVELFNLVQAAGFWWTVRSRPTAPKPFIRPTPQPASRRTDPDVQRTIDIVEPTVLAATRMEGADITVWLLDDGDRPEMAALAAHHGIRYIARQEHRGAKAGNLNHALRITDAPFVAVFDCDHVPAPEFLLETLKHLMDGRVAFVQTPQYYINRDSGHVAAAAATQQDLFFGVIAPGKNARGAMFCCGTNVVLRRRALEDVGGFPTNSLTEDFEMSVRLHERGWTSVYVPTCWPTASDPRTWPPTPASRPVGPRAACRPCPASFGHGFPCECGSSTCWRPPTSCPVGLSWCTCPCRSCASSSTPRRSIRVLRRSFSPISFPTSARASSRSSSPPREAIRSPPTAWPLPISASR